MNAGGVVAVGQNANDTYAVDATGGGTNNGSRNSTGLRARGRGMKPGIEAEGGLNGAGSGGAGISAKGHPGGYFEGQNDGSGIEGKAVGAAHGVRGDASSNAISCGVAGFAGDGHAGVQGNAGNGDCGVEGIGVGSVPGVLATTLGTSATAVALKAESADGYAVHGISPAGIGVRGESTTEGNTGNVGVSGRGDTYGVSATGVGVSGSGLRASGVGVGNGAILSTTGSGAALFFLHNGTGPAIRFAIGVPASPTDGDLWFDGSDLKLRVSGATFTLQKA
jgi:hypothetical protein